MLDLQVENIQDLLKIFMALPSPESITRLNFRTKDKLRIEFENMGLTRYMGSTNDGNHSILWMQGSTIRWIHKKENTNGFTEKLFLKSCHCQDTFNALKKARIIKAYRSGIAWYYTSIYATKTN